jgi:hypothetical protein
MAKEFVTPKHGSSPLYTPPKLKAQKRSEIQDLGTDIDGAYRLHGRKRETIEAEAAE